MSTSLIKVIGIGASVVGAAATLLSDWVCDKKLDEKIEKEVAKALRNR